MKRLILFLGFFVAAVASFSQQSSSDSASDEMDKIVKELKKKLVGKPLPAFSLTDLNGKKWSNKDLNGKVAVFNFWFTSCKPCLEEMPLLNKLVEEYKGDESVVFLAPALDGKSLIGRFLQKKSFDYHILPEALDYAEKLSITAFPTHLVVDAKGIVRELFVGGNEHIANWLAENIRKVKKTAG